jgi:methylmalonyl-CoA mutase N-terminal domain/subunit
MPEGPDRAVGDEVRSEAGIPLASSYGPADLPLPDAIPPPGQFPFTRGNFPDGYRGRLWTIRQYSGFGTPEESNERYRYLLAQGGTGLSVALDLPTQCGYDSDHPDVEEEVGRVGVALDTLADAEILFDQIPLDRISTSFTINGTAAILLAFYVAVGEQQGVPREKLRGTIQNDILKEYVSRGTWIWPPKPSLRLIADTIEFCAEEVPRFNAISVAGAHFRDAGANAAQEMAFTLMDGITYCDEVMARGRMTIDEFAPQVSFFFYTHGDFFEEIAKYRAGRRRWAHIVRDRYGAKDDRSCMFRMGCVAGGASLYAPQAHNNIVRVAYEALASVLGGVQSMFTAAWDEPFALPSEDSATLALRTQQVLAYETGVARVADPLGGSYYVEALTDEMEAQAEAIFERIRLMGELGRTAGADGTIQHEVGPMTSGILRGIEEGWFMGEIADAAFQYQLALEKGEKKVVGVNTHTGSVSHELEIMRVSHEVETEQVRLLADRKAGRDQAAVEAAVTRMVEVSRTTENMVPAMLDAVRAEATLGEICDALRAEWGEYREPARF